MEDMESKMGAILNNPEMMQKIMTMAQSLTASQEKDEPRSEAKEQEQVKSEPFMNLNPEAIQKLASFAGNNRIDRNQQTLLRALSPY